MSPPSCRAVLAPFQLWSLVTPYWNARKLIALIGTARASLSESSPNLADFN